jgi:AAA15 family ATPase/GTPase
VGDDYWGVELIKEPYEDEEKTKLLDFLRAADLGIEDVIMKEFSYEIEGLGNHKSLDIKTVHKGMDGELVNFDIDDESEGTQKLFSFAIPWMDSLAHGHVLVIDELHDNLHPRLVQFLVELFHNDESNPNNAQLIFTTHETSILNQEVFRRDQIWFCEKDEHQASTLYPLTDFSPRKGRENLELAYLSGRYGALPYVRPLREAG